MIVRRWKSLPPPACTCGCHKPDALVSRGALSAGHYPGLSSCCEKAVYQLTRSEPR